MAIDRPVTSAGGVVVALAIITAACVACGTDAPTTPTLDVSGTWVLRTVNGYALPFGQLDNSLLADTLFLQHDGTGRRKAVIGYYGLPFTTRLYDVRWTLTDRSFTFTQSEGSSFVGTATA